MKRFPAVWAVITALVMLALVLVGAYASNDRAAPAQTPATGTPQMLTAVPGIQATLTAVPAQPDLPAQEAAPYQEIRDLVDKCPLYTESRKIAVLQQIDYVLHPSTVPQDFTVMFGDSLRGRMIFGSAYLTAVDWKEQGEDKSNCLYSIGVRFNALLPSLGEKPLPEFQ